MTPRAGSAIVIGGVDSGMSDRLRQAWARLSPAGQASVVKTPSELIAKSANLRPEIVVIPELWLHEAGLNLLASLSAAYPVNVVVCGERLGALTVAQAFTFGLRGLLAIDADTQMIEKAVAVIRSGEMWISRRKLLEALHAVAPTDRNIEAWRRLSLLSDREQAVLAEVLAGLPNKNIADKLSISESTVKAHMQHLYLKLGVHRRTDLFRAYFEPHPN